MRGNIGRALSLAASLFGTALLAWAAWRIFDWGVLKATWSADSAAGCTNGGACWAVLTARHGLIMFGLFPAEGRWRAGLACLIVLAAMLLLRWPRMWRSPIVIGVGLFAAVGFLVLMYGGILGLEFVPTDRWGGFALTLCLYLVGVVGSLPLAVVLALMRRNSKAWVSQPAAFVVDGVRTLPSVSILFAVAVLLPMVLPDTFSGSKFWRVAIAFAFMYGCYQSEVVRAGLQSVQRGQIEASIALGLSPFRRMQLVVLPQALISGIPAGVNLLVLMFKETSLVAIIGFFDFTASAQAAYGNADWLSAYIEVYVFIGAVYFLCTIFLSWWGAGLESKFRWGR